MKKIILTLTALVMSAAIGLGALGVPTASAHGGQYGGGHNGYSGYGEPNYGYKHGYGYGQGYKHDGRYYHSPYRYRHYNKYHGKHYPYYYYHHKKKDKGGKNIWPYVIGAGLILGLGK